MWYKGVPSRQAGDGITRKEKQLSPRGKETDFPLETSEENISVTTSWFFNQAGEVWKIWPAEQ